MRTEYAVKFYYINIFLQRDMKFELGKFKM